MRTSSLRGLAARGRSIDVPSRYVVNSSSVALGGKRAPRLDCATRASSGGNSYEVESHSGLDNEAYEQFPNVMPYTVKSVAWSAKRKRMRSMESQAWKEEMESLKSQWTGQSGAGGLEEGGGESGSSEADVVMDDWHWCDHAEALKNWEEERRNWASNRDKAFRVAQQRLNSYRASQPRKPTLPDYGNPDPNGFYSVLGISCHASAEELKMAFRAKAKDLHPDVAGNTVEADAKMKTLLRAYTVLKDPASRTMYDMNVRF